MQNLNLKPEPKEKTSFELITNWLDIGYTTNLSSNAINLMTHLLRFYNPTKKFVFPHQNTLAERTKLSLATIKRTLAELIQANLLIKSRSRNGNLYAFTGALFELLHSSSGAIETAHNEPCINRKNKLKDKTTRTKEKKVASELEKKVVVLSPISLIPSVIRNNPKIKNPSAYWRSLKPEAKEFYLEKEKELESKKLKLKELEKQEEIEKQKEIEHKKQVQRPLKEQFSKAQAIEYIKKMSVFKNLRSKNSLSVKLAEVYNLNLHEICANI